MGKIPLLQIMTPPPNMKFTRYHAIVVVCSLVEQGGLLFGRMIRARALSHAGTG